MCKSKIEILFFGGLLNKSHSVKFPTKVQGKWMGGLTFQDLTIMSIILHPFYDVYYSRLTNLIHFWDPAEKNLQMGLKFCDLSLDEVWLWAGKV